MKTITLKQAEKTQQGIFIYKYRGGYAIKVHLFDRTTYYNDAFRHLRDAEAEAERLTGMYTQTPILFVSD